MRLVYFFILPLLFFMEVKASHICADLKLKEFKVYSENCATGPGRKLISGSQKDGVYLNPSCYVKINYKGGEKTINFLSPLPYDKDSLGLTYHCEGAEGKSTSVIPKNCKLNIYLAGKNRGDLKSSCQCTDVGCGQYRLPSNAPNNKSILEALREDGCGAVSFGRRYSGKDFYISAEKCEFTYSSEACGSGTAPRYLGEQIAIYCKPIPSTGVGDKKYEGSN